jgi:hypothetical protein
VALYGEHIVGRQSGVGGADATSYADVYDETELEVPRCSGGAGLAVGIGSSQSGVMLRGFVGCRPQDRPTEAR